LTFIFFIDKIFIENFIKVGEVTVVKKILPLSILLILLLFILNVASSQTKVQITFMTPLSGADGAYMDQIIQNFNKENPDVNVVHMVVGSSVEYKQKLSTGLATKSAPQVLLIRKFDLPMYLNQMKGFTLGELAKYGINIKDVYPNLLDGLVKDNKYYGIPLDVWIFYMAYNKANFRKAGLDPERPPRTREEFIRAMEALKKVTPKGLTPYYENPTWAWIFVHFLWQFGGDLLTPDFKKPAFKDAAVQTLKFLMDLQERGIFPKAAVDPGPPFQSGQTSVLITGIWTINPWLQALGKDFGYAPCPQVGTTKAVFGGSHIIALPEVMVQDPKIYQASMKWVKYLWDHALDWYAAGQTPSRRSIATSDELKKKLPHIYVVAQQLPYVKTFQFFPYISEVLDEIAVYLEDVLITRKLTPEQAMERAEKAVQRILDDYWSTAK
jgi:multiple sugar transport system substrate-binding protein